ncbi:MAG TPA: O-antigen ligase family protein [Bacteroidia bacterium]|jgi:O-antigen ligase|nr:O-antigen ligase family protein [Bacteroidia bacterium]
MAQVAKIKYWFLCLVPFVMCTYAYWAGYAIIGYLLCWLLEGDLKRKVTAITGNKFVWLFISFFVLHIIGMLYTSNASGGWFIIQVKLSLLLFPILLSAEGSMEISKQKPLIYSFIAGCVANSIVCLIYAIWLFFARDIIQFQYMQFSILMHPSYFSMYIDLAMLFTFYLFTNENIMLNKAERGLLIASVLFLEFMLVLLQSKMGMIISAILLVVLLVRAVKKYSYKTSGLLFVIMTAIYFLTFHFVIGQRSRVAGAVNSMVNKPINAASVESTQARSIVWKAAIEVIELHPFIGVGTGSADTVLVKQYLNDGYTGVAKEHLNTHDQYLQTTVILGVIGLLSLLACFIFPFFTCINNKRFIYGAFLLIVAANFLVESMLETQSGTIFYGFFNSLLMFNFVI